jgi:hypothetical protein
MKQQVKKSYVRPQLVKHGNVETTTQGKVSGSSSPISYY